MRPPKPLFITPQLTYAGSYTCQIFWKGDPGIENFIIKFTSEETMKKWAMQVDTQRRMWKDQARTSASTTASRPSDTQFAYMRDQVLENPYQEEDEEDAEIDQQALEEGHSQMGVHRRRRDVEGEGLREDQRLAKAKGYHLHVFLWATTVSLH